MVFASPAFAAKHHHQLPPSHHPSPSPPSRLEPASAPNGARTAGAGCARCGFISASKHGKVRAMTELDDLRYPIGRFSPAGQQSARHSRGADSDAAPAARAPARRRRRIERRSTRHALPRRRLDRAPGGASPGRQPRQGLHPLQAGADRRLAHHQALRRGRLGQAARQPRCPSRVRWR